MIDEKLLIEKLNKNSIFKTITNAYGKNIYEIIDELQKLGEWIPVSERMPEYNVDVIVCNDDGKIHVAFRQDSIFINEWRIKYCCYDYDIWDDNENGKVIAWMPLPEPYRGDIE